MSPLDVRRRAEAALEVRARVAKLIEQLDRRLDEATAEFERQRRASVEQWAARLCARHGFTEDDRHGICLLPADHPGPCDPLAVPEPEPDRPHERLSVPED